MGELQDQVDVEVTGVKMVQEGKGSHPFAVASDQLQLMVKPRCCMLYINNI